MKNNIYHGKFITYFESGNVESKGFYCNGLAQGDWKRYDKTGVLVEIISYEAGVIVGHEYLEGRES